MIGVCIRGGSRSREAEKGVDKRREHAWADGSARVDVLLHGRVVEDVVEDALRARRVGDVPDDFLAVAHLQPVQVDGRVWVCEGPCCQGVLGAYGGEGCGAEDGGAYPEGVTVGGGEGCCWGWEGEEVLEDGGAVIPVEGEGVGVRWRKGGLGEVSVVEESDGQQDVDEECVLWRRCWS